MSSSLNPYLTFGGNAREAMELYQRVLGGELTINTFGEFGAEGPGAEGVMHAHLATEDGMILMASDMPPGEESVAFGGIAISLSGDDTDRLRSVWEGLREEAEAVITPLERQMWGDDFGQLRDRFGVMWMVNILGQAAPDGSGDHGTGSQGAGDDGAGDDGAGDDGARL